MSILQFLCLLVSYIYSLFLILLASILMLFLSQSKGRMANVRHLESGVDEDT